MICWVGLVLIRWRHDYEMLLLRSKILGLYMDDGAITHCIETCSGHDLLVHIFDRVMNSDVILKYKRTILIVF